MKIIGLTGQSGAGKGTVASIFEKYAIPHIDCDKVYHSLLTSNSDCTKALADEFGAEILSRDGSVDRKRLGTAVFCGEGHAERLEVLNRITHKFVLDECRKILADFESQGKSAAVVDAPTLFESGFDKECDVIISVVAPLDIRLGRITERDRITREKALERFSAQKSEDFFRKHSDFIIENTGGTEELDTAIQKIIREILS